MKSRRLMNLAQARAGSLAHPTETLCGTANLTARCPLWVKSGHRGYLNECPLYPRKRTCTVRWDVIKKDGVVTAGRTLPGPSRSLAGTVELIKDRDNLLTVFGIWIHVLSGLEQRDIFGAKFFLQFVYLLGQVLGFLAIFVPINLIELITEIEDLAIGLGFSPIATDDADDLL